MERQVDKEAGGKMEKQIDKGTGRQRQVHGGREKQAERQTGI